MPGRAREDTEVRADPRTIDPHFALLFLVMLTIAAGNTALQSILPALGRSLGVADRALALLGVGGFAVSLGLCGLFLAAGINGWIGGTAAFGCFIGGRLIYGTFG